MAWTVEISPFAWKQLAKLDRPVAARIIGWLDDRIEGGKNPQHFGEALTDLAGLWRYGSALSEWSARFTMRVSWCLLCRSVIGGIFTASGDRIRHCAEVLTTPDVRRFHHLAPSIVV